MAEEIRAEIVGSILEVNTREGQDLHQRQTVMVLESMKMEIPVTTEYAGRLRRLAVQEGDTVIEGDLLAIVD